MSEDNKWSKPASPPPPLFLGEKERNLVKQVNDEIIERVMYRRHYSPLVREQIIERLERITARELAPKIRETAKAMQTEIERDIKKKLKKKLNLSSTRGAGSVA